MLSPGPRQSLVSKTGYQELASLFEIQQPCAVSNRKDSRIVNIQAAISGCSRKIVGLRCRCFFGARRGRYGRIIPVSPQADRLELHSNTQIHQTNVSVDTDGLIMTQVSSEAALLCYMRQVEGHSWKVSKIWLQGDICRPRLIATSSRQSSCEGRISV